LFHAGGLIEERKRPADLPQGARHHGLPFNRSLIMRDHLSANERLGPFAVQFEPQFGAALFLQLEQQLQAIGQRASVRAVLIAGRLHGAAGSHPRQVDPLDSGPLMERMVAEQDVLALIQPQDNVVAGLVLLHLAAVLLRGQEQGLHQALRFPRSAPVVQRERQGAGQHECKAEGGRSPIHFHLLGFVDVP
jgi:hypothetical protein